MELKFKTMNMKMSSAKWWSSSSGLIVLTLQVPNTLYIQDSNFHITMSVDVLALVLDHQQAQCWLQNHICFCAQYYHELNISRLHSLRPSDASEFSLAICDFWNTFFDRRLSFKMAEKIQQNFIALWLLCYDCWLMCHSSWIDGDGTLRWVSARKT